MKNQKIKDTVLHVKEYIVSMPKKRKLITGSIAGGIIVLAAVLTLYLNGNFSGYRVLYTQIDAGEASAVFQTLKEMGASPQMNAKGEVMVPGDEYDIWLLRLAEKGFPQSTLTYDVFANYSGMTATESEKEQWLLYQLQDRIQATLKRITGVENAVVTITVPKNSDYVWDQATNENRATVGVLLTLQPGTTLTTGQITAIKNLIASSVPQMLPADVTVVDGKTSLELKGDGDTQGISTSQNLEFEQMVQKRIEDNIVRVLAPRYGAGGVVASAKVTLNYDKMITEKMELQEKPQNPDGTGGGGYTSHTEGEYTVDGNVPVSGIVGEEDNTDIPTYGYATPNGNQDKTYYTWSTDLDYSYIKTQVEKGNVVLERATVSVMVDEPNMTQVRREELTSLISNSADIAPELIFVSPFNVSGNPAEPAVTEPTTESFWADLPLWAYFVAGGVLLLVIGLIVLFAALRRRKKQSKRRAELLAEEAAKREAEAEISTYKKQIFEAARAGNSAKEDAIVDEIRDFARGNPEITANLLRSWLKEGED